MSDGNPIGLATVYINGTSNGTISDAEGNFHLSGVTMPSELIISHVSYELKLISLLDPSKVENLWFAMNPKVVKLEEAVVIGHSLREDYINRFKTWFLGEDYLKYDADILNDSILIFNVLENDQFTVDAHEPVIVSLPATGYILKVDLVKFELFYREELQGYHCSILGYYYFNPIEQKTPRQQRTVARNRIEQYYNSIMHFCKSLYHNSLLENGYLFEGLCDTLGTRPQKYSFIQEMKASYGPDQYGNQQLLLTDFKCKAFNIAFYYNARNRPVDLTYLDSRPTHMSQSGLLFLQDSIHIYPSGRIPENSVLFRNTIALKGIKSMLPEDYIPSMQ